MSVYNHPKYLNPSWISLRNDLGIPDDSTIAGIGPSTFGDSYYGTLNLPARVCSFGYRPAETVTQRIQSALDLGSNGPVGLLWDVRCSVGAQATAGSSLISALWMRRPGNLSIRARRGCGLILRPGCNASILANEMPTFGPARSGGGTDSQISDVGDIQFGNVLIEGMILNANSGTLADYTHSANQGSPTFGQTFYLNIFRLFGVQDITLRGCTILGAGGFHVYMGNWLRMTFDGLRIDSLGVGGTYGGNDCLHFNGPGDGATVRNCHLATEDDHIALNCADGNNHGTLANVPAWGSLTNVRAYNTNVLRASTNSGIGNFVRVMACAGCENTGHVFDGIRGAIQGLGLIYTSELSPSAGSIGTVDFRDLGLEWRATGIRITTAGGGLAGLGRLGISGVRRSGSYLSLPLAYTEGSPPINRIDLSDIYASDDGSSGSPMPTVRIDGGTLAAFSASGVGLDANSSGRAMPLLKIGSGGTVDLARISNAGAANVAALVDNGGTLGTIVGSNIDPGVTLLTGNAAGTHKGDYYL